MSAGNNVNLIGRLTRKPELKTTARSVVCSFTLAVNRIGGNDADFISCTAWSRTAQNIVQFCNKGTLVSVNGHMQSRTYEDSQNQKRFVQEVVVDSILFLSRKKDERDSDNFFRHTAQQISGRESDNDLKS